MSTKREENKNKQINKRRGGRIEDGPARALPVPTSTPRNTDRGGAGSGEGAGTDCISVQDPSGDRTH